jgi:hypothetical protein
MWGTSPIIEIASVASLRPRPASPESVPHFTGIRTCGFRKTVYEVPVTNAIRTIVDVWKEESLPRPDLQKAFREAVKRGAITKTQIANYQKDSERGHLLAEIRKGSR